METIVVMGVVAAVMGSASLYHRPLSPRERLDRELLLAELARRLQLVVDDDRTSRRRRAHLHGADILLELPSSEDAAAAWVACISAPVRLDTLELQVVPCGGLHYSVARTPFSFSITTGDPTFDSRYAISTNRPALARLWLDGSLAALTRAYPCAVVISQGRARMRVRNVQDVGVDGLMAMLEAVASVSTGWERLQRAWTILADALGGSLGPRLPGDDALGLPEITVPHDSSPITIVPQGGLAAAGPVETHLAAHRPVRVEESFVVRPTATSPPPARPPDGDAGAAVAPRITATWLIAFRALGARRLIVQPDRVTLVLAGFIASPRRIRAASAVLASLIPERPQAFR